MEQHAALLERRQNLQLRAIFDEVYERIEPFLDPSRCWGGSPMTALAYRAVRESYPELSPVEAYTLVVAVVRVYRTGHRATARTTKPARLQPV